MPVCISVSEKQSLSLLPPLHQSPLSRWCFACADWHVHSPGLPFPEKVPPDPAALPQQLSVRNSCHHCTLLGVGEGRRPAVSETLPAPMEEDASRQY